MKVLHVLDHSLPLHSGYSFRSRNVFLCQINEGLTPATVTSPKHEASLKKEPAGSEEQFDGVRYFRTGAVSSRSVPFLGEWEIMRALGWRLEQVAKQVQPAVIHAHSPVLNAFPALRVGKTLGIPVVYEVRAFWEDAAADHGTYRPGGLKYHLVRFLETQACRRADAVVTICEGLRQDLLSRGLREKKITVVPNAVDAAEFRPAEKSPELESRWGLEGRFVVGFLGSFYHYEGIDLLLDAVARIASAVPDLAVLLVGGGAMDEKLRNRARALGLEERVVFTGRLPHDQMPDMYGLVDLLVFPRKRMRLTELVTPLKPLEAMAMRKAVLASDVGGHRELIRDGETGVLFRAGDVEDLAEKLKRLSADPDALERLGKTGLEWVVSERTWSANGKTYAALYERICASR